MDIKIDSSWFRFLTDLPSEEIKKIARAVWDYANGKDVEIINSAAWETIKASIDSEIQHKKEVSEQNRNNVMKRWHPENVETNEPEPEVVTPEIVSKNPFEILTDDPDLLTALQNPESGLSVFIENGSGYDELTSAEREFVDRGDVRKMCPWYKEKQDKPQKRKSFVPPTLDEWLDYCREKNLDMAKMRNAYESYVVADWHDSQGNPIRNWKQKILQVWAAKPQNYNQQTAKFGAQSEMAKLQTGIKMAEVMLKKQGII